MVCSWKNGTYIQNTEKVWLFDYDGEVHLEAATTDEVAACKWMTVSEIRQLYEDKKLVQTLDYFFCVMEADQGPGDGLSNQLRIY